MSDGNLRLVVRRGPKSRITPGEQLLLWVSNGAADLDERRAVSLHAKMSQRGGCKAECSSRLRFAQAWIDFKFHMYPGC